MRPQRPCVFPSLPMCSCVFELMSYLLCLLNHLILRVKDESDSLHCFPSLLDLSLQIYQVVQLDVFTHHHEWVAGGLQQGGWRSWQPWSWQSWITLSSGPASTREMYDSMARLVTGEPYPSTWWVKTSSSLSSPPLTRYAKSDLNSTDSNLAPEN